MAIAAASALAGGVAVTTLTNVNAAGDDPLSYNATTPCRLADTREEFLVGPRNTPLSSDETHTFTARGAQGQCTTDQLPADAEALALNITPVGATAPTFLTIWPDGTQPNASSLNPAPGQPPIPNAVTTPLSATGTFNLYNLAGNVNVIIDVNGNGTATQNGHALRQAVTAVGTPSASDPWEIHLEPGVFDVGVEITLPDFVSVRGSGKGLTTITGNGTTVVDVGAGGQLVDLAVTSTSTATSKAVEMSGNDARLQNIRVEAGTDANADAIRVSSATGIEFDRVEAIAPDFAILVLESEVTITNGDLTSTGDAVIGPGDSGPSTITITHSRLETSGPNDTVLRPVGSGLYTWHVSHSVLVSATGGSVDTRSNDPSPDQYYLFHNLMEVDDDFTVHFDDTFGDAYCAQNARLDGTTVVGGDTDCY